MATAIDVELVEHQTLVETAGQTVVTTRQVAN
jgi:hypothetical protein